MQAQQLVEEQRRQMDMMDMDNTRISEQINLEIQRVKVGNSFFKSVCYIVYQVTNKNNF